MTLSSALSNSITGLAASTRQLDTTANNIANATTEGYARRSVELSSISLNGAGGGVRIAGIDVAAVEALTNDRRRAEAEFGRFQTLSESLGTLEDLVGGVDDPGSLFNRYQAFETSLRDLADNPESSVAQLTVVTQAKAIVEGFDRAQTGVTKLREEADAAIAAEVSRLNVALEELKELNVRVQRDVAIDRDASESVAARQTVIDTIADIVPIRTKLNANGQLQVFTTGGAALVDLSATTFEFTNSPIVTADADYRGGAGSLSGISVNGIEVTPGVVAYGGLEGGTLAAWFEVRDGIGVDFQNQIDSLAADLIDRFDDPLVEPGLPVGDPGLFTDGGVANTGAPGLAGRLQVNALADPDAGGEIYRLRDGLAAVAPGVSGDNSHAIALLEAFTADNAVPANSGLAGTASSTELVADFTSLRAGMTEINETGLAARAARFDSLLKSETLAIGVDIDFELQNLTLLERAYAANARVVTVIDELFDLLLTRR